MKRYFGLQLSIFLVTFLFSVSSILAQENDCNYKKPHQADTWVFGNKARFDFTQDPPSASQTYINPTQTAYGVSSISDDNGNLLIFTNGMNVWNRYLNVMDNGTGLSGSGGASQSSIVIPHPGNNKQFFVFTIDLYIDPFFTDGINYSVVDFTNNSGGSVTSKNNHLFSENSQKVCAVKHENDRDYWVIFHGFGPNNGNKFYSYLVDTSGVVTNPIVSTVGVAHTGGADNNSNNERGYMKASSNGTKIALALPIDGIVELLDFNKTTGLLSNPVTSDAGDFQYCSGVEFSPDNSKLYITTTPLNDLSYLYQFDITNSQPFSNPVIINSFYYAISTPADSMMDALQLGVDGKIYVAKTKSVGYDGKPNISVIYNPNRSGLACNYNELDNTSNNGIYLNGSGVLSGLPTFVTDFLNIPPFYYFNQCHNDTTEFEIRNTSNIEPSWDFKDSDGTSILNDIMKPKHIFSDPGTYSVELTEIYNGIEYNIYTENVIINPLPSVDIGMGYDTIYILPNSSIRLDAGEGYDVYSWTPGGSSSQYLDVNNEGLYSVSVTDFNCCTNSDAVYVKFATLTYPTAFNPTSTYVVNQTFTVAGNIAAIAEFQILIFNRWGQLIFESDDPTNGWDGNYNGSPAPMGTYVYSSVFTSYESGIQSSIDINNTGTITLIR